LPQWDFLTGTHRTRIALGVLKHILQALDLIDGLKAMAMTLIPGWRSDSMNDMWI
jgi:hypothetical protein